MGSIPSYSLIGTRGLREFVCAQTAEDRETTMQELAHKGALPPKYSVSFPRDGLVSRIVWIAVKILLFPLSGAAKTSLNLRASGNHIQQRKSAEMENESTAA